MTDDMNSRLKDFNDQLNKVHQVDERQLTLLIRDWRRGRATRSIWQAITDAYVAIFASVLIGAMIISTIITAQSAMSGCTTTSCITSRSLLPWAAMAAAFAFTLSISLMFGPILVSSVEGFWLLDAPLRRRKFLVKRLWAAIFVALIVGAIFGALVAALTGSSPIAVLCWTLGTGLGASGLAALAAAEQGAERTWVISLVKGLISLAGLATIVLVIGTAVNWFVVNPADYVGKELSLSVAGAGFVILVICLAIANYRLDRIRRQRLVSGGALLSGVQGAMFALDFALVRDILVERKVMRRGHVRPTRGRALGIKALVLRDVQRVFRFPKPLILWLATMIVPYAVQSLGLGMVNLPISALFLVAALVPFMNSLRVLSRNKGLARCFPFSAGQVRSSAMIVPAIFALLWAVAVVPAFLGFGSTHHQNLQDAMTSAFITAVAGLLGAIRWVSAKPPNYNAPMVATQMGAMPPGLALNLIRGFDIVALVTLPMVLGLPTWVSFVIAFIAFMMLRSGKDREAFMEENAEHKRMLEEAKKARNKPSQKIRVSRRGR